MPAVAGTPYAVRADLANLGLIGSALQNISNATQDAALLAASAVADSKLQGRYVLPLTSWGYDIVRAVCIIAAYDLMVARGYNPAAGADPNIRQRYLDAIEWLENVGKGTDTPVGVVDSSGAGSSDNSDDQIAQTHGGLQMTTSGVRGWTDRGRTSSGSGEPSL